MTKATNFLREAAARMDDRAVEYDKPGGERSMRATVAAFAAITGHDLTESEGFLFMECLKNVRLFSAAGFHRDSAEDGIAYGALKAEAREAECRAAEAPGVRVDVVAVPGGSIGTARKAEGLPPLAVDASARCATCTANPAKPCPFVCGTGAPPPKTGMIVPVDQASKVGTCVRPPCDRWGCVSYCGAKSCAAGAGQPGDAGA